MAFSLVSGLSLLIVSLVPAVCGEDVIPRIRRDDNTSTLYFTSTVYDNSSQATPITSAPSSSWTDTVLFCSNIWSTSNSSSVSVGSTCKNSCIATWNDYLDSLFSYGYGFNSTTFVSTYTYHNITASMTTLCDGHPRIVGDLTTLATGTNTTLTSSATTTDFTKATPACKLAPKDCTSFYGYYGSANMTSYCTETAGLDCGQCRIAGGTVQLIYFPITATPSTSVNLCPDPTVSPGNATLCPLGATTRSLSYDNPYDDPGCYYALPNSTSTPETAKYIVSGGDTFYQDKVYVSLQTVIATNNCGHVGKDLPGTILTLQSSDIFTIGGYHHEFADVGYSFNFNDMNNVPSYAYYLGCDGGGGDYCSYAGTRYSFGRDWLNGVQTLDLGNADLMEIEGGGNGTTDAVIWNEAYQPTLLAPLQLRMLQPAWHSCALDLGGLYDPPKALTEVLTEAGPSGPAGYSSTTATPAGSASNTLASATALPVSVSAPMTSSSVAQSPSSQVASPSAYQSSSSQPESSSFAPPAYQSSSVQPASTSIPSQSAPQSQSSESTSSSQGIGGIIASVLGMTSSSTAATSTSVLASSDPNTEDPTAPAYPSRTTTMDPADPTMSDLPTVHPVYPTFKNLTGSIQTVVASSGVAVVGNATVSAGHQTTVGGQTVISTGSSDVIIAWSQTVSYSSLSCVSEPASGATVTQAVIIAGGSTISATRLASGSGVVVNGNTLSRGQSTTIGSQVVVAGTSAIVVDGSTAATFSEVAQLTTPTESTPQQLTGAVVTAGGATLTAVQASSGAYIVAGSTVTPGAQVTISVQTVSAASSGLVIGTTTITAVSSLAQATQESTQQLTGAVITAGGATLTAVQASSGCYIVAGSTITQGQEVTISGQTVSAASSGLVVGGTTISSLSALATATAAATGAIITAGGTEYTALVTSSSLIVVNNSTVAQGSQITVSGHIFSAGTSEVVVDGTQTVQPTQLLPKVTSTTATATYGAIVTISSSTYVVEVLSGSAGPVMVAGQTIAPDSAATIDGVVISDASSAVVLQGTSTIPLSALPSDLSVNPVSASASISPSRTAGTSPASSSSITRTNAAIKRVGDMAGAGLMMMVTLCWHMYT